MAGVTLAYILLLILFTGFLFLLFPLIVEQSTTIAGASVGYYKDLREWMVNFPNSVIVRLGELKAEPTADAPPPAPKPVDMGPMP